MNLRTDRDTFFRFLKYCTAIAVEEALKFLQEIFMDYNIKTERPL
jgi:hypothetical protein